MRQRPLFIFLVAFIVYVLDRVSKHLVSIYLVLNEPWYPLPFLKPIFGLTYIHNTGAAFGIFQNQNLFFIIVAIIVITVIVLYVRTTPRLDALIAFSLALQLGGACGNLTDRLLVGYVTDFLHLKYFAISNVADVCISLGTVLLGYHLVFRARSLAEAEHSASPQPSPPTTTGDEHMKSEAS